MDTQDQDVAFESVEQFGNLVVNWHQTAVHKVMTMANIPDDVIIEELATDDATEGTIYTPEQRQAYRQGMLYALEQFGTLPFGAKHIEDDFEIDPMLDHVLVDNT